MSEDFKNLDDLLASGFISQNEHKERFDDLLIRKNLDLAYKVFSQFSQNSNYLNSHTFSLLVSFLGENFSQKEFENVFYLIDNDHNGQISFQDLLYEPYSYDSYELELFRFIQNKLKSRSYLSNKLSPTSSSSEESSNQGFYHIDIVLEVGRVIQPSHSFTLRRSVNDQLTREIRSRASANDNSCILTLQFLLTSEVSVEAQDKFLATLKLFYDSIGLHFLAPHVIKDHQKDKSYLVFDGLIEPPDGAIELLELLDPQLIDGRIDLDTSGEKLGASLHLKSTFSKAITTVPILQMDKDTLDVFALGQDLTFKLKVNSLADLIPLKNFNSLYQDSSEDFKTAIEQISRNDLSIKESLLQKFYTYISKKKTGLEPEIYSFFEVYPHIVNHLDSLQSVTLIIKDQVLTLDINSPGHFKLLPVPTAQNLEDFSQVNKT